MITAIGMIFTELLSHYEKKWAEERSAKKWHAFEEYEDMRSELGVEGGNLKRIPRRKNMTKSQPSHQKHRY